MRRLSLFLCASATLSLAACDSSNTDTPTAMVTAHDDTAQVQPAQTVVVDVLRNDTASDGAALRLTTVNSPMCGSIVGFVASSGAVTFQAPGTVGSCTFTYTATSGSGGTDTATVAVAVQGTIVLPRGGARTGRTPVS